MRSVQNLPCSTLPVARLPSGTGSYVERQADQDLNEALAQGEYWPLTSMGTKNVLRVAVDCRYGLSFS